MVKNIIKKTAVFSLIGLMLVFIGGWLGIFTDYATNDYSDIMKRANKGNPNFGNSLAYDIAMLGTHDAMSDKINANSEIDYGDDVPDLGVLLKLGFVRSIIANYCRTQSVGLAKQLQAGARYIDLRITCRNGIFYGTHGLVGGKFEGYLKELITFLLDHPGEFVVFNIAQYNRNEGNTVTELAEYMKKITVNRDDKDYSIYDFINYDTSRDFSLITYNDVTENGTKGGVVIVSRCFTNANVDNVFLRDFFKRKASYATWYNKSSSKELLSMVDAQAQKYKDVRAFRCNGLQTTQDATSIATHLGGSLIKNAESENVGAVNHSHFDYWLSCMPIVCFDEVISTKGDFNKKVNDKILNYNLNLNKGLEKTKYNKITSESELKDGMKIILKEENGVNGYIGNKFDATQVGKYVVSQFVANDNPDDMWILKKSGDGWKIKMPNGKWLDRNAFGYLVDTKKEKSGVTFKFDFTDSGTAKIHYDKYYMYISSRKVLDLSKKYSSEFEIYA